MHNLILLIALSLYGNNKMLFVADITPELNMENPSLVSWKRVFHGHGRLYANGDTLILLTERNIVIRTNTTELKDAAEAAKNLLEAIGLKGVKLGNYRFTSKFGYTYTDENGEINVGVIELPASPPHIDYRHENGVDLRREAKRLEVGRPVEGNKSSDSSVAIMFNSNSAAWAAIDTLHSIYANSYVDLEFSNRISERIDDLRSIKPQYIIVVADPQDLTPDFMYDADTTTRAIDDDRYHDAVLSFVTGYGEDEATDLARASNSDNDATLTIANPDGSLLASGYSGVWLSNYLYNDGNALGNERLYVNTTSSSDPDITAINIADELNNLHRGNVFFSDHGWISGWALRGYTGDRAHDVVAGYYSDLKTWEDTDGNGYLDTPHGITNGQNSFVFADACITARLNGARETNWSPWETAGSNVSATPENNIALAWMKDSPGYYIGSHSVSYGSAFLKPVLLGVTKGGVPPAVALKDGKDIYNMIIGHETTDNDSSDGTTDDFLEYLRHEFVGLGKPTWMPAVSADPSPDYTVNPGDFVQQDQLPDNDRGCVYAGTGVKWLTEVTFRMNEELAHEPAGDVSEDSMPFTYIFVENVGGDGSSVWADGECAVLPAVLSPGYGLPEETDSIQFADGNPGDPNYHLYDHPWYGSGSSEAYEIFKADINSPSDLIMLVAAGVTDVDNDGYGEWRINNGYTKTFNIFVYTPAVTESIIDTMGLGDDHWLQRVQVSNEENSASVSEVIVRVPITDSVASVDSVTPSDVVHDVVVTSDSKGYNIEFTISSVEPYVTDTFSVYYTVAPSGVNEPINPGNPPQLTRLSAFYDGELAHVRLSIAAQSAVRIAVYDASGRLVAKLHDGILASGSHEFSWEPSRAGVYTVIAYLGDGKELKNRIVVVR